MGGRLTITGQQSSQFARLFDRDADVFQSAPGRVNLIGEHTDYNGGYVLPIAIPQRTDVYLAKRSDDAVRVHSSDLESPAELTYMLGQEERCGAWHDYVEGITWSLQAEGYRIGGVDVAITSSVPLGKGLASSAALEVALLRALRAAYALPLDDVQLALVGHRAETEFVGAPVGIMDQMASSLADEQNALFLDTRKLVFDRVPLPGGIELVVIDSGIAHSHASGEYRVRRAECEEAAKLLGVGQLREIREAHLGKIDVLPEPLRRRARHVVTENERVLAAVDAMHAQQLADLGDLLFASHRSLRDDFEVSIPEIDLLVETARADPDVYGARITGGGFGGAVIVLTHAGRGNAVAKSLASSYKQKSGRTASILLPQTG